MQPDLTVSRTYTSPMCFQDSIDKELMAERSLLDPLPDLKVKGQKIEPFLKAHACGSQLWSQCLVLLLQSEGSSILLWTCFSHKSISEKTAIQRKNGLHLRGHHKLTVHLTTSLLVSVATTFHSCTAHTVYHSKFTLMSEAMGPLYLTEEGKSMPLISSWQPSILLAEMTNVAARFLSAISKQLI